jgi:hypothetical protein
MNNINRKKSENTDRLPDKNKPIMDNKIPQKCTQKLRYEKYENYLSAVLDLTLAA